MKIFLANGCSCSQVKAFPKTWERPNATIKKDWYIYYRFYDPTNPKKGGYLKIIKRMNDFKTLKERQQATRDLIRNELRLLKECAYNPITETFTEPERTDYDIEPGTGIILALEEALKLLEGVKTWKDDIASNLRYLTPAAEQLRYADMPIKDIKRRHLVSLLDQCGKNKDIWTAATYNRYRRNLSSLFRVLVTVQAIEHNPIDDYLPLKKQTKELREVLTPEEIVLINTKLRPMNFLFWRFIHMFCNSGARITEIMVVQLKGVDLCRQMVRYTIRKGEFVRVVERPIKDNVLYLWEQMVVEAKQRELDGEAYIFSEGLQPGPEPIRADQIRHRWRLWVQQKLGIQKTIYPLKHLNTDMMDALYDSDIAAHLNQHNKKMVEEVYAVGRNARKNEVIKKAPNPLTMVTITKKPA